ncbi:MAG: indole-3-glycerol phosphate synthase TrpC [Candidatus Eremiobacteraeota bacterium]|nr:indole-3-glycerol phosphate synthase TrpC [Candidatus Eremiobacteraeota bacterium]
MVDILSQIYAAKAVHRAAAELADPYEMVRARGLDRRAERRDFATALRSADGPAIIAEIKRASPSAGLIVRNFDPGAIARMYEEAGVDAISVLTEQDHFLGDLADLDIARANSSRPILRKDFLANRYEVAQSAAHGADCILLIVAGLTDAALAECVEEARAYDLGVLVEVHDAGEATRALALGADAIGINNRNLRTFETDLAVSEWLLPLLPAGTFAISESGMRDADDVRRLRRAGAGGFLIGEALMRATDPRALIRSLREVERVG